MSLPDIKLRVTYTDTCLTLTHGDQVGEFFLDEDKDLDLWQLDDFVSKLIAWEAERQHIRAKLSGK